MKKFFMLTRGRTGSTAILDELSIADIYSMHELFLDFTEGIPENSLKMYYQFALPFDLWKKCLFGKGNKSWNEIFVSSQKNLNIQKMQTFIFFRKLDKILPFLLKTKWKTGKIAEKILINQYLSNIEKLAIESNRSRLVFKVLSHHLIERKSLFSVLQERGYSVLHLVRKNVVRQVLSGMIAKSRGAYNRKNYKDNHPPCIIDLNKFEDFVAWEKRSVDFDRRLLKKNRINYLEITYEDFCEDRKAFYSKIFSYIGINYELPKSTEFSIMVPDIRKAITNYNELERIIANMGMANAL